MTPTHRDVSGASARGKRSAVLVGIVGGGALLALVLALVLRSASATASGAEAPPRQQGLRTVVIDPGHGGSEIGATAPNGLLEKEITLDIARRLRALIQARLGLQVALTRDRDVDLPLEYRTADANRRKADLFVSIHANAYRGSDVRGPETYFLSPHATNDLASSTAGVENTLSAGPDAPDAEQGPSAADPALRLLLWDMAQTLHLRESGVLAEYIQEELNLLSGIRDRGVKQAPFRVLMGATMPAVLVEVGFLSNPDDAARLADAAYRQQLADAIFRSIGRFRRRLAALQRPATATAP